MAGKIDEILADPTSNMDGKQPDLTEALLRRGRFPGRVPQSLPEVRPEGHSREQLLAILSQAQRLWLILESKQDELANCPARSPHFLLGQLTAAEWVRFCAVHNAHHLSIARDILVNRSRKNRGDRR